MTHTQKPILNKRIFWDIDERKLDYQLKASFIIERVFERGDVEDIRQCRRFYGNETIKKALMNAKYLSLHTMYLASAIFNNPLSDYRCYILQQSNPQHYQF